MIYVREKKTEYEILLKVMLYKAHGRDYKSQKNEQRWFAMDTDTSRKEFFPLHLVVFWQRKELSV